MHSQYTAPGAPRPPVCAPACGPEPCATCDVRHLSICGALSMDETSELAKIVSVVEHDPHDPITSEGEPAEYLFNVTAGAVGLHKLLPDGRRQITGFLFPGDFLGIAMNEAYAYSAEAVGHVRVCRFPRRKLEALLDKYPALERRLLGVASNELVQAQDQMLLLGRKSAKEKLCSFLLRLSKRSSDRGGPATPVLVPMSRADIGDYLGLTTETVSRNFTQLKTAGVIQLREQGTVHIPDLDRLRDMAEES